MKTRTLGFFIFLFCLAALSATARPMVGVRGVPGNNQLFAFDSTTPGTITSFIDITGLGSGENIQGIDFRPANGVLYALGITTSGGNSGRIYTIDLTTGVATQVGNAPFSTNLSSSGNHGFDFNPVADLIRVTNGSGQNLRVDPDTGLLAGTDTPLTPAGPQVVGLAYDRSDRNPGTATTLFGIDFQNDKLVMIGGPNGNPSPNAGAVSEVGDLNQFTVTSDIGFDIAEDGLAFACLPVEVANVTTYRFYTIDLGGGNATAVGDIGSGSIPVRAIAAVPSRVTVIESGEFFSTIQGAINDAQTMTGHTIAVNAGTFNELVTVNKPVILLGAKAGLPGLETGRGSLETVVRGAATANGRTSAFRVTVDNVTIDGFAVQDASDAAQFGAGIVLAPNIAGTEIRNNILQNNIAGLIVSNDTANNPLIVEFNLFGGNNLPGPASGSGIFTNQTFAGAIFTSAVIDRNFFVAHSGPGVALGSTQAGTQSNVVISNNFMLNNGNGLILQNLSASFVTGNEITGSVGSQIAIGGGVNGLDVSENSLDAGSTRGIRIGTFFSNNPNTNIVVGCNSITGHPTAGLEIDNVAGSYTGTLAAQNNWWGDASGPTFASNPGGTGQALVDPAAQVVFQPFLFSGTDSQPGDIGFQCHEAPVFYGINAANNNLVRFKSNGPETFTSTPLTGLVGGDPIVGLDFRPATGELFGISGNSRLYVINPATGVATQRGSDGGFTLNGTAFGFDFNPLVDRIRVVSDTDQNLRINPNNGVSLTDTPLDYAAGDPNDVAPHDVGGAAYLNSFFGSTRTTLYDIDTFLNVLARQGSFGGTPVSPDSGQLFTVGPLGVNPDNAQKATGFDIFSPVPGVNLPFAALTVNGTNSRLHRINLVTGETTLIGTIGGANPILLRALTAIPTGDFALSAPTYSVNESGQFATITINRLRGSQGSVTVQLITADVTAVAGADYVDSDQTITFAEGEVSKSASVPIINDGSDEFDETILLQLSGPFHSSQATATLTIADDDVATPTLTAQASPSGALGEPIFNTASITGNGVVAPSGTLTFQLFGPNDNSCSGAPIFTSVVNVNGNGNYTSESFTPTTPGAYNWVVIYNGDGTHNAPVTTDCGGPNQTITATDTVLGNIATRLRVEIGDNVLIAGFIITGNQPKKVIVRGIGSSLPFDDKLADPTLELRDSSGALVDANDNWMDSANKQAIIDSTIPPSNDLESAIVATLAANGAGYTAILRGVNDGTGIGVVEAYDLDRLVDSELANISTRGFVSTGDNILIAGTIVVGKNSQRVIVRAIGPSLPLANKMADPTLELRDSNGELIEANDNWVDSPNKQAIIDSTIPPSNDLESAIVAILNGNNSGYTAIVRGVNGTTGIAVVELYALP